MFAWGLNQHGQCGVGELTDRLKLEVDAEGFRVSGSNWILNVYQPLVVKGLPTVSEVCCGWSHVLAVTGEKYFTFDLDHLPLARGDLA